MLSDRPGKGRPTLETNCMRDVGDAQRASRQQGARAFQSIATDIRIGSFVEHGVECSDEMADRVVRHQRQLGDIELLVSTSENVIAHALQAQEDCLLSRQRRTGTPCNHLVESRLQLDEHTSKLVCKLRVVHPIVVLQTVTGETQEPSGECRDGSMHRWKQHEGLLRAGCSCSAKRGPGYRRTGDHDAGASRRNDDVMPRLCIADADVRLAQPNTPFAGHDVGASDNRTYQCEDAGRRGDNRSVLAESHSQSRIVRHLPFLHIQAQTRTSEGRTYGDEVH